MIVVYEKGTRNRDCARSFSKNAPSPLSYHIDFSGYVLHNDHIHLFGFEVMILELSHERQAEIFKALADERRLRILGMLKGCERCACAIQGALDLPQSSLAYHMRILCNSGLVTARRDGKWTYYSINASGCLFAAAMIQTIPAIDIEGCPEKKETANEYENRG